VNSNSKESDEPEKTEPQLTTTHNRSQSAEPPLDSLAQQRDNLKFKVQSQISLTEPHNTEPKDPQSGYATWIHWLKKQREKSLKNKERKTSTSLSYPKNPQLSH